MGDDAKVLPILRIMSFAFFFPFLPGSGLNIARRNHVRISALLVERPATKSELFITFHSRIFPWPAVAKVQLAAAWHFD